MKTAKDIAIVKRGEPDEKRGEFEYPVYESTAEAISTYGEEKALKLFNAKVKTEARNAKALELQGKEPGAMAVMKEAKRLAASGDKAGALALIAEFLGEPV